MLPESAEENPMGDQAVSPEPRFEWFEGSARGARSFPTCSLTKSGSMTLNDVAVQMLCDPVAVQIGYNAEERQIGLRASLKGKAGAIPLRHSRKPDGTDTGSRSIYARSVLLYYDVLPEENNRFQLENMGAGVYAVSLSNPLPKSRAGRKAADQ